MKCVRSYSSCLVLYAAVFADISVDLCMQAHKHNVDCDCDDRVDCVFNSNVLAPFHFVAAFSRVCFSFCSFFSSLHFVVVVLMLLLLFANSTNKTTNYAFSSPAKAEMEGGGGGGVIVVIVCISQCATDSLTLLLFSSLFSSPPLRVVFMFCCNNNYVHTTHTHTPSVGNFRWSHARNAEVFNHTPSP